MYECGCKNGFVLSSDGYNCIIQGKLQQKKNRYVTRINIFAFFGESNFSSFECNMKSNGDFFLRNEPFGMAQFN